MTLKNKIRHIEEFNLRGFANVKYNILLFLIHPLLSLLYSIRNFRLATSRIIIVGFFALFGYGYVIPDQSYDIYRIVLNFKSISNKPFIEFFQKISLLFIDEKTKPDFGLDLISFIVSRISDSPNLFILTLALTAGIILIKNIQIHFLIYKEYQNINSLIFLIFFIVLLPIYNIGQFRFYSATLIFVLGSFHIFNEQNKIKYLLLTSISIFFHFSYALPVVLLVIYLILGNRNKIYIPLLISSFLLAEITLPYLKLLYNTQDTGSYEQIIRGYTSKAYFKQVLNQNLNTMSLLIYQKAINKYFFFGALIIIYFSRLIKDKMTENIISFSFLLLSFINYFEGIRDINQRFGILFSILISILLIKYFVLNKVRGLNPITLFGIIILGVNIIIFARYFIGFANITLLLPTPISTFIIDSKTSILDLIR